MNDLWSPLLHFHPSWAYFRLHGAIIHLDVYHFHKKLMSQTRSLLGPNISHLEVCSYPFHTEAVGCNVFPYIVIVLHDVSGMLCVFVATAHSYCTFAVKVDGSGLH
jgi:hypothetical protein